MAGTGIDGLFGRLMDVVQESGATPPLMLLQDLNVTYDHSHLSSSVSFGVTFEDRLLLKQPNHPPDLGRSSESPAQPLPAPY